MLRLGGQEVEAADSGRGGVQKALAVRREGALVDLGLPGLSGHEVARRIRTAAGGERMLLIALSGYSHPDDVRRTREAGFDAHLVKPVDLAELTGVPDQLAKGWAARFAAGRPGPRPGP